MDTTHAPPPPARRSVRWRGTVGDRSCCVLIVIAGSAGWALAMWWLAAHRLPG